MEALLAQVMTLADLSAIERTCKASKKDINVLTLMRFLDYQD